MAEDDSCESNGDIQFSSQARITINVSGCIFETYEKTLANFPETLLGNPGKRLDYCDRTRDELVFTRNVHCFDAILFYYQSKGILSKPEYIDRVTFEEELKFFQISSFYDKTHKLMNRKEEFERTPPNGRVKEFLWRFFQRPSLSATVLGFCNIAFVLAIIVISCIESLAIFDAMHIYDATAKHSWSYQSLMHPIAWLKLIEIMIMIWFTIEYLIRIYIASKCLTYILSPLGILDLICPMFYFIALFLESYAYKKPYLVHIIKMLRFSHSLQLFRLARYSDGLRALLQTVMHGLWHIRSVIIVLPLIIIFFASIILYAERNVSWEKSSTLSDWCWFVVITMTTVGYGDICPQTIVGRWAAVCCALCGVILLCLVTPTLLKHFVKVYYLQKFCGLQDLPESKLLLRRMQDIYNES